MVHAGLWQLQMGFWLYNIAKGNGPWNYVIYLLNIVILDGKLQTITYERLIIDPPERGIYWKYNYRKKKVYSSKMYLWVNHLAFTEFTGKILNHDNIMWQT